LRADKPADLCRFIEEQIGLPGIKALCTYVTATQPLEGAQDVRSLRLKLDVSLKDLLKGGTVGGQHAV